MYKGVGGVALFELTTIISYTVKEWQHYMKVKALSVFYTRKYIRSS